MIRKAGIVFGIVLGVYLLFPQWAPWWYDFLAPQAAIEQAQILLVEGWVSDRTLRQAAAEFASGEYESIVIGSIHLPDEFMLHSPGYLVFALDSSRQLPPLLDKLQVMACSSPAGGSYAMMHIYVNGQKVGQQMTGAELRSHIFPVKLATDTIRSIAVHYQDDHYDWARKEDRNLYVHSIILDDVQISSRAPSVYYDRGRLDGEKIEEVYVSRAGSSAEFLVEQGVAAGRIQTIDAPREQINKTYTTALAVSEWLKKTEKTRLRINLITESSHARRSWMLYRKAFTDETQLGIISSDPLDYGRSDWWEHPAGRNFVLGQTLKFAYAVVSYPFI